MEDEGKTVVYVNSGAQYIGHLDSQTNYYNYYGKNNDGKAPISDDELRDRINKVLPLIKQNRHWFCIIKVLMLRGLVKNKDFKGAAERIRSLYPGGLEVEIDPADLQSMHNGSFMFPLSEWSLTDGPFKREYEFKQYLSLAQRFNDLFG